MSSIQGVAQSGAVDPKQIQLQQVTIDAATKDQHSTTDWGLGVTDQDNWLNVSSAEQTGPQLLEDHIAREKINRFDHERIPERVVHARGVGAFGTFTLLESAADVTKAKILTEVGKQTPMFARMSTILGSRGSADNVRDVRGFALKFYTSDGNWDLVGNNIPVFFLNDAMKFPDLIHAGKPEPRLEVPQAQTAHNNFWDFQYLHPEATHMFMWAMSDRAIPRSYRMMQGFGVNTYRLVNKDNISHFVKFHYTPMLGVCSVMWDENLKIGGQDPDFLRKDLAEAIDNGVYPKWKFGVQVLPEHRQDDFDFDILDATKVWPEELVPIRYIGEFELNRNPDEYFPQTEMAAFCTSHIVPGIEMSDDPILQGRNFSYLDTQISRLGVNFQQLPINRPVCPMMNFHRDGAGQHRIHKGNVNYWPNRFEATPPKRPTAHDYSTYPEKLAGIKARTKSRKFQEHINQAELFYNSLPPHERKHLELALCFELDHCDDPVVYSRICDRLAEINLQLAQSVAAMVGAPVPDKSLRAAYAHSSKALAQSYYLPPVPTIETRRVAILITDGFASQDFAAMMAALEAARAFPYIIGSRRSLMKPADASASGAQCVMPAHHFEGLRSTMVDAVFVPNGSHVTELCRNGRAVQWVREAFAHCKAIAATGKGVALVREALGPLADGNVKLSTHTQDQVEESYGVITAGKVGPEHFGNVVDMMKTAEGFLGKFFAAISKHRIYEREIDGLTTQLAY
ncbi:catalase 1 [Exophiala xenobiotica]|nr:catalase 1 [Exophiala xenobiotica]KAK5250318.1 catalase 1 [Exophiala xenobiotica]KAK5284259.1 catalase 1 [Exophiala xenobiotica]KAK5345777.1 catalase 1 [Exophiala xenobiotica]KAK5359192.1 catalase 1 [Exophiala xenobiotica]